MEKEIWAYSASGIETLLTDLGHPRFRAKQLLGWLYGKGASSYDQMTDMPKSLRQLLQREHPLIVPALIDKQVSQDGTSKYLFEYSDGARAETVAIPSASPASAVSSLSSSPSSAPAPQSGPHAGGKSSRLTVCVSTQVGCTMGCTFCATGKEGFTRNLFPGEIVSQVIAVQKDREERVSNLVSMGQGEPFLNYENTIAALRIANDPACLAIGARHTTISTCGIINGILRLAEESEQFTLAVSLHSAVQSTRDQLMPRVASSPLSELRKALVHYTASTNRRPTLEYIMIDKVNDTARSLEALIAFCSGLLCHVNLLPVNPVKGSVLKPSRHKTIDAWVAALGKAHIPVTVRNSRGTDIAGACGQLKNSLP